ncbi:MAG: biotin transporter BioY [Treponema sp.]|jgi:biotin transport system substrate-specific component|nr:biotin transporter BioY [Treponema sp.]
MSDNSVSVSGRRKTILGIAFTALFAALTAGGSFISIPLPFSPVPIVLTNFFVILAGLVLGPFLGTASIGVYLIAGAIGAPVFAGGSGGFVHFLAPSGGFLYGYLLAAFSAGFISGRAKPGIKTPAWRIILGAAAGALILYAPGLIQLKLVTGLNWKGTFMAGFVPFLIGDAVKVLGAALISPRLRSIAAAELEQ